MHQRHTIGVITIMRKKTSRIWLVPKGDLQKIINESSTMVEVLRKLDYNNPYNGNHATLKLRVESEGLDLSIFNLNHSKWIREHFSQFSKKVTLQDILVENSTSSRGTVKRKVLESGLKKNQCELCGINNQWNDKPLSLQLDHINGINNDNRLENLRILCPNCHSQSDTYGGRNAKKEEEKSFCSTCQVETSGYSNVCNECSLVRKFDVEKADLERYVKEMPFTKIGKMFNVTDNSVRKRCKSLGIAIPKYHKGHWLKKNASTRV